MPAAEFAIEPDEGPFPAGSLYASASISIM
jgi:hypothetical protein